LEQTLEDRGPRLRAADASRCGWSAVVELMTRPQPVTISMVALFAIIPIYLYIGVLVHGGIVHVPELALDRMVPVQPEWSVIYGSLFLAALLPVFVVHQQELVRRTILAYLTVWLFSYVCFLAYPTIGPRPAKVIGEGFFVWALRAIYSSDVRYNCLPSLHVAQCFLAALTCYRVHRGVGAVAGVWAFLVGLSTLYTKQHYVLDVIAGMLLAYVAYVVFLRSYPREDVPERERRLAPALALGAAGIYALIVAGLWFVYAISGT
jgi:membrane-associated phospholipid phosphatase